MRKLLFSTMMVLMGAATLDGCGDSVLTGKNHGNGSLELRKGFGGNADTILVYQEKAGKTDRYVVVSDTNLIKAGRYDMWLKEDGGAFWLQGNERTGDFRSDVYKCGQANLRSVFDATAIPNYEMPILGDIYLKHLPR